MNELLEELQRFRNWLLVTQPIRVLVRSTSGSAERDRLEARLGAFPELEVTGRGYPNAATQSGEPGESLAAVSIGRAVPHSDIVVLLAPHSGEKSESALLDDLVDGMMPITLAHQFRKRRLAWGIVQPALAEPAEVEDQAGPPAEPIAPRPTVGSGRSLGGVLRDRDMRILREAWKGDVRSADGFEREVVPAIRREALRVRLFFRALRVLAAAGAFLIAGWLLVRFGFFGLLLVLGLGGGVYLRVLDRRWTGSV